MIKRLIKKQSEVTTETLSKEEFINKINNNEQPTDEEVFGFIKENFKQDEEETYNTLIYFVKKFNQNISPELEMQLIYTFPKIISSLENVSEAGQDFIADNYPKLKKMINNPTSKKILNLVLDSKAKHEVDRRDFALAYINGKVYEASDHPKCVEQYEAENEAMTIYITHRTELPEQMRLTQDKTPIAFAHLVEEFDEDRNDFTYVENAIYIDTTTVFNVTLDEVVDSFKKAYPHCKIYDDNEYEVNYDEGIIEYTKRLAKLKKQKYMLK